MSKVKKNDFIEVEFTGRLKEGNIIFDTTDEGIAKDNELYDENKKYKPLIVCVGQAQILKAIEQSFENKSIGESYTLELKPDMAFGKKDADLIQLIPTRNFLDSDIQPIPGLSVNIDGILGMVKAVSGGRTIVDFNHPLAGKEVIYEITIKRLVTDKKEKLTALLRNTFNYETEIELNNEEVIVFIDNISEEQKNKIQAIAKELIPEITTIKFNHKASG